MTGPPLPPEPEYATGPGPCAWHITQVGRITLPTGDTVPLVRVVLWLNGTRVVAFLSGPEATTMSDQLRTATGGLTIASELPGQ